MSYIYLYIYIIIIITNLKFTTMKLYHGSQREITETNKTRAIYFSTDIEVAKEYALGLDDCGNYNDESWIYSIEIDETKITKEDDFYHFDCIGYQNYNKMADIVHNEESDYYCIKSVNKLTLIENYKNEL